LKQAFAGQLVPQDPADEPASVLLARIRAEKAKAEAQGGAKPRKKKKTEQQLRLL
jgi:type I restriction enzyme S subunit